MYWSIGNIHVLYHKGKFLWECIRSVDSRVRQQKILEGKSLDFSVIRILVATPNGNIQRRSEEIVSLTTHTYPHTDISFHFKYSRYSKFFLLFSSYAFTSLFFFPANIFIHCMNEFSTFSIVRIKVFNFHMKIGVSRVTKILLI